MREDTRPPGERATTDWRRHPPQQIAPSVPAGTPALGHMTNFTRRAHDIVYDGNETPINDKIKSVTVLTNLEIDFND